MRARTNSFVKMADRAARTELGPLRDDGMRYYDSALEVVGHTPLVKLRRVMDGASSTVLAKIEYLNPGGSVKDRPALAMIREAEESGLLKPGGTIVEATSGNTGTGLAMVAAIKGYRCILVMPDKVTIERRNLLKAYGAQVILTPGAEAMKGAIAKANEIRASVPAKYFMPQQFRIRPTPRSITRVPDRNWSTNWIESTRS